MTETPIELDKHRGMAAQKATDIRRVLADVEANAKLLRDKQGVRGNPDPCRAGHVVARGGGQSALRPQSLFGQSRADRHASPRPRGRGACGPYPALRGRDLNKPVFRSMSEHFIRRVPGKMERPNRKHLMQNLSPRHVMTEESLRLGVESGWYSTKVSGTFVSGPHSSEADCLRRIAEINPPAAKKKATERSRWKIVPFREESLMTLARGNIRGYEDDRMVLLFSMMDGAREVPCAVSAVGHG